MIKESTKLDGVYVIKFDPKRDDRGFVNVVFNTAEFGLAEFKLDRCLMSYNKSQYVWRGLHYQLAPYEEIKLVKCIKGVIDDVIVDLRSDSPTYKQWVIIRLDALDSIYVPKGCAHGYLTLTPHTQVFYCIAGEYNPKYERGIRFNDPSLNLPIVPMILSDKDANWPDLK